MTFSSLPMWLKDGGSGLLRDDLETAVCIVCIVCRCRREDRAEDT